MKNERKSIRGFSCDIPIRTMFKDEETGYEFISDIHTSFKFFCAYQYDTVENGGFRYIILKDEQ